MVGSNETASPYNIGVVIDASGSVLRSLWEPEGSPSVKMLRAILSEVERWGDAPLLAQTEVRCFGYVCGLWLPGAAIAVDLQHVLRLCQNIASFEVDAGWRNSAAAIETITSHLRQIYEKRAATNPTQLARQVMGSKIGHLQYLNADKQEHEVRAEIERYVSRCVEHETKLLVANDLMMRATTTTEGATSSFKDICKLIRSSLQQLLPLFGGISPLCGALRAARERFALERQGSTTGLKQILIVVSDGISSDGDPAVEGKALAASGVEVITCLVAPNDVISPKILYSKVDPQWSQPAKTMFGLATPMAADSELIRFLHHRGWKLNYGSFVRPFTQINHSQTILGVRAGIQSLTTAEYSRGSVQTTSEVLETDKDGGTRRTSLSRIREILRKVFGAPEGLDTIASPIPSYWTVARMLANADQEVRMQAADDLAALGDDRALDVLVEALKDPVSYVRLRAARALGALHTPLAVPPLVEALRDSDYFVRWHVTEALARLPFDNSIELLGEALNGPNAEDAAAALGNSADPRAIGPLLRVLGATSESETCVRVRLAMALGELRSKEAVEPLIDLLRDPNDRVRTAAAESLGQIGDERAIEPLATISSDPSLYYNSFGPRKHVVAEALARFGSRGFDAALSAVNAFISEVKKEPFSNRHSQSSRCKQLARTLAILGDARAVSALVRLEAIDRQDGTREVVVEALKKFDKAIRDPALQLCNDLDERVREVAKELLDSLTNDDDA